MGMRFDLIGLMSKPTPTFRVSLVRLFTASFIAWVLCACTTVDLRPKARVKANVSVGELVWRINNLERSRVFSSRSGDLAVDTLENIMVRLQISLKNTGSSPYAYGEVCTLVDALGQEFPEHALAKEAVDGGLLPRTGSLAPGATVRFKTIFEVPKDSKRLTFRAFGETDSVKVLPIPLGIDLKF